MRRVWRDAMGQRLVEWLLEAMGLWLGCQSGQWVRVKTLLLSVVVSSASACCADLRVNPERILKGRGAQ